MSATSVPSVDPLCDLHLVVPFALKCGQRRAEDRHAARLLPEQNRPAVRVQCFSAGSIGLKYLECEWFFTGLFKQLAFGNMSVEHFSLLLAVTFPSTQTRCWKSLAFFRACLWFSAFRWFVVGRSACLLCTRFIS